jgi:hypothetical protein
MYYPYLRGKQFELIALRELSGLMAESPQKISPIIEPVKNSSTLKTTISKLINKDINFNIILNPSVGDLTGSTAEIIETVSGEIGDFTNFQLAIIIDSKIGIPAIEKIIQDISFDFAGFSLIHFGVNNKVEEIISTLEGSAPVINNIVYFNKTSRRYYRSFLADTRIGLDDYFNCLPKNSDYLSVPDSQFSEEHLFYKEDGYKGFSDFLTIGDNYSETGFLPYAVAIHLSYLEDDNKIRIKHFVSDSNDDTSDIGGKFAEAIEKLVNWCNENNIEETIGINQFKTLHDSGHFPGLGSIKKLSVMHHIELVKKLI